MNDKRKSHRNIPNFFWLVNLVTCTTVKLSAFPCFLLLASDQSAHNVGEKRQWSWGKEASFGGDESHWYCELWCIHGSGC